MHSKALLLQQIKTYFNEVIKCNQNRKHYNQSYILIVMMHIGYRKVSDTFSQNFTRGTLNPWSLRNQITCKILYTIISFMADL